jgi:hypothetical protein
VRHVLCMVSPIGSTGDHNTIRTGHNALADPADCSVFTELCISMCVSQCCPLMFVAFLWPQSTMVATLTMCDLRSPQPSHTQPVMPPHPLLLFALLHRHCRHGALQVVVDMLLLLTMMMLVLPRHDEGRRRRRRGGSEVPRHH